MPSTQPLLHTQPSPRPEDDIWGWLIPLADGLTHLTLTQAEVRAGRDHNECTVVFTNAAFHHTGIGLSIEQTIYQSKIFEVQNSLENLLLTFSSKQYSRFESISPIHFQVRER